MNERGEIGSAYRFGKIQISATSPATILAEFERLATDTRPHLVVTPNVAHLAQVRRLPALRKAYAAASLFPPDGWPLVLSARVIRAMESGRSRERQAIRRTTGADLLPSVAATTNRYALIGGRADSALLAAQKLSNLAGQCVLADTAPPEVLKNSSSRKLLIERVAAANADFIFIGLGVPKQEELALELLTGLSRGVVICVGAAIDFAAGTVPRAPKPVRIVGLEWAYRILREPKRLGPRYLEAGPYFLATALAMSFPKLRGWRR